MKISLICIRCIFIYSAYKYWDFIKPCIKKKKIFNVNETYEAQSSLKYSVVPLIRDCN